MDTLLPPGSGVLLCGHGSRNRRAIDEFAVLAETMRDRLPGVPLEHGYLEFANPVLHTALDRLVAAGVRHVLAVPGMLFAAGHAKNDIPTVLRTYEATHPGIRISYGRELGVDPHMLRAASDRVREGLAQSPRAIALTETLLLVVGRGASDPDANSNVAKVTRMLWEGMGFGWAETAYSGVTFPLVAPALEHAVKLGYRRIVVFPYFLFTGVLVNRIYDAVAEAQAKHPELEILAAPYLDDHPLVVETLLDRIREILVGQNLMNCALCKYREQVLGFEADRGLKQESHHLHVEGIEAGPENCPCGGDCDGSCRDEAFCRRHGLKWTPIHDHAHPHVHGPGEPSHHHHAPSPHAGHPLGPVSLPKVQGRRAREERP